MTISTGAWMCENPILPSLKVFNLILMFRIWGYKVNFGNAVISLCKLPLASYVLFYTYKKNAGHFQ